MSTHTPRPWKLNWHIAGGGQHPEFPVLHYVSIEGGEYGDDLQIQPLRITGYVSKPDAFLLAAAPDLLAACRRAKKLLEPELEKEPDRTIFWELVNAISKAERQS